MQKLLHQLKYKGNRQAGIYLGRLMGFVLSTSNRFSFIDGLVPLPLFPSKERRRGYNQAKLLCDGMSEIMNKPVLNNVIIRINDTESQTRKGRIERWQNMEGRFRLVNSSEILGRHILLVDDVVTTGASLEACGRELLAAGSLQLSLATLCFSSH